MIIVLYFALGIIDLLGIIVFFRVCLFNLIYPTVCLCRVRTVSYLSSLNKQLWLIIVCLLPKIYFDIRFRRRAAKSRG